jgi:hypothetical protein
MLDAYNNNTKHNRGPPQRTLSVPPPSRPSRTLSHHSSSHSSGGNGNGNKSHTRSLDGSRASRERLAEYNSTMGKQPQQKPQQQPPPKTSRAKSTDPDAVLVQYLALQSFHLPGNSYCQDWWQYMFNNHPVFGICCHHRLHPIKACTRIVALVGTIIFGLAMTNFFYLFYLSNPQFNQVVLTLVTDGDDGEEWTLTTGMLLLWTVGGTVHTMYNLAIWHIAACGCCRRGGCFESCACCPSLGKQLLRVLVVIIIGLAAMIVLLRVGISNNHERNDAEAQDDAVADIDIDADGSLHNILDDEWTTIEVANAQEFQFLLGYLVEMVLAFFIYYPIGGTILFSGILGCGRLPMLGGRPYEVAAEERRKKKKQSPTTGITLASTADDGDAIPVEHFTANEHDLELVWSARAAREFER